MRPSQGGPGQIKMIFKLLLISSALICVLGQDGRPIKPSYRWIDLTYALNKDTIVWPGRQLLFGVEKEGELPDGTWVASKGFCISEHTSTHIDSPYHFNKNGKKLSELPIETMLDLPGICIDINHKVHKYNGVVNNYVLTRKDIIEWESLHGPIPAGSLVLVRSGWGDRWPDAADYMGVPEDERNGTDLNFLADPNQPFKFNRTAPPIPMNFPGFDASAATFLSTERNVNGVGIDTLSLDPGNSKTFMAHKIFTKNGVFMLENVANLHLLPPRGFQLYAVPFKVDQGTGAPTRVLAKVAVPEGM